MESKIKDYIYSHKEELLAALSRLIEIPSVKGEPVDGAPFGKETADCLAYFLRLAESFGFETHNYDNYVGEVVYGEGEELAVLAHLDVVPAGSGWKY
ncbi:MAG: dipeptidase PepV, partial [Oscillospiraceae bacterium]|nr:dipeptidase PepV [Oscillospiraceae bacterium]